jgi:hypothetical protein
MLNLSTGEATLVLAGCVVVIGAVFVLFRRGIFGGAKADGQPQTPAGSAKP